MCKLALKVGTRVYICRNSLPTLDLTTRLLNLLRILIKYSPVNSTWPRLFTQNTTKFRALFYYYTVYLQLPLNVLQCMVLTSTGLSDLCCSF